MEKTDLRAFALSCVSLILCSLSVTQLCGEKANLICIVAIVSINSISLIKNKKLLKIIYAVLFSALAFVVALFGELFVKGFKIVSNDVFEASELSQNYFYDKFELPSGAAQDKTAMLFFLVCIFALLSLLSVVILSYKKYFLFIFFPVSIVCFEIYFGIAPVWWLNLLMLASFVFLFISSDRKDNINDNQSIAMLAVLSLVVIGAVFVICPDDAFPNKNISAFNEEVRDVFDDGTIAMYDKLSQSTLSESSDKQSSAQIGNGDSATLETGKHNAPGGNKKHPSNSSTVSLNIVAFVLVLLCFSALLVWLAIFVIACIIKYIKLKKHTVRYAFSQSVKLLYCLGIEHSNKPFSYSFDDVEKAVSDVYCDKLKKAYDIYCKSVYSSHKISNENKAELLAFYKLTSKEVMKRSGVLQKLRIKFIKLL